MMDLDASAKPPASASDAKLSMGSLSFWRSSLARARYSWPRRPARHAADGIYRTRPARAQRAGMGSLIRRRISAHDEIGIVAAAFGAAQPGAPFPHLQIRAVALDQTGGVGPGLVQARMAPAMSCIRPRSTPSKVIVPARRGDAKTIRDLSFPAQPLDVVLDPHPVDDPAFRLDVGHRPVFPAIAGIQIAPRGALVALDYALRLDQVEQPDIGRLARSSVLSRTVYSCGSSGIDLATRNESCSISASAQARGWALLMPLQ